MVTCSWYSVVKQLNLHLKRIKYEAVEFQTPSNIEIKKKNVEIIIPKVLGDLTFSRNQPLKSKEDKKIGSLKNKIKTQKGQR